jgi:SAM-dependent methyltransferase
MPSLYNEVAYPGHPFAQTHPDRLSAIAALFGVPFAPVRTCRVLELGCGDGGNIIPMAAALPEAQFTGVDLAETPIAQGNETITTLGLRNIKLHAADLLTVDASWGEFDYIITHGLYSWTPPAVRDQILKISKQNLARAGVAYISYNALPGGRIRQMLRELMLFQAADFEDPAERIEQAKALLGFVATATVNPERFNLFIEEELERIRDREPWALFHDELADIYEPVYFHQFIDHATAHGLQYLAEASLPDMEEGRLTPEATGTLDAIAGDDRVLREQYVDFARCRAFRQTLLCHAGNQVESPPKPERLADLYASTAATALSPDEFRGPLNAGLKTEHPQTKAMLHALVEAAPQALSVAGLQPDLRILLATAMTGLVDLHTAPRLLSATPGPKPEVSPLARYQLARDLPLTTLHHATLLVDDPTDRELILLLDGTRTQAELKEIPDAQERLMRLARLGLLTP